MIKIQQLKLPPGHGEKELKAAVCRELRIRPEELLELAVRRRSLDARKKEAPHYSYVIAAKVENEAAVLRRLPKDRFCREERKEYVCRATGSEPLACRPIVVGTGPAGLLCGYQLALFGYRPLLLERGKPVEERVRDVEAFFAGGDLQPESNVQFGEGGAGTFSDGKLNTLVKDRDGRGAYVFDLFARMGAPEEIRYINKPHIGTDRLRAMVQNLREEIIRLGGEVRFESRLTDLRITDGRLNGVVVNDSEQIDCQALVLAIGHSARDTFEMLRRRGVPMEPKAFAMGVRIQHPRSWVDACQYGEYAGRLPSADYKLTHTCRDGRGVYTFCMCPGGYVVNASSEKGRLCVNGMSNYDRAAENSNSALVVTVTPEECAEAAGDASPLAGMYYQRRLEEAAYRAGNGRVPTQTYADFAKRRQSEAFGTVAPCNQGAAAPANLWDCLPQSMAEALLEGIEAFDRKMPGFAAPDALLSAVEARTSSPVRIVRDEATESAVRGLYPCGEGAGYAGGITSAAMDGLRVAEALLRTYAPPKAENERKEGKQEDARQARSIPLSEETWNEKNE